MIRSLMIAILLYSSVLFGQNTDNLKTNDCKILSAHNAKLLNSLLKKSRVAFDFEGKKVAFITGSSGNHILSESEYFKTCINPWLDKGDTPQIFMVLLTQKEKDISGGYDVFILSWTKLFTDRQKKRIIKRLIRKKYSN